MRHLTDTEMVELIYDDFESDVPAEWSEHLAECPSCRLNLDRLRQITQCLSGGGGLETQNVAPSSELKTHQREKAEFVEGSMRPHWQGPVLVASLLLFVASGAFIVGSAWQVRSIENLIDRQLLSGEYASVVATSVRQSIERETSVLHRSIDLKLRDLDQVLDELHAAETTASAAFQKRMHTALLKLADNQRLLRSELETLALTAESEIASAKRDIELLNQLAISMGIGIE